MKFLFAGTSHEYGGAEVHFVTLTKALAAAGHTVEAVVRANTPIAQALAGSAVRLHLSRFRNVFDLRGYRSTIAAARRLRPDWLVADFGKEYWPLILIGRLLGIPAALFRHRLKPMNGFSARLVARCAQRFFAVSECAYRDYVEHGMPAGRVQILYNPVDMDLYRPDPERRAALLKQLGLDEQALVLGCFGRMHAGKGIFTLLDAANAAMAREPRLHCLWLGDGIDARKLRERIAASPFAARHHQFGWIADVHAYYSVLSLLAFPSISPEVFGRSSVEAQACGVPVLASTCGAIPDVVGDGGWIVPERDPDALGRLLAGLADNAALVRATGQAARRNVETRFTYDVVAGAIVSACRAAAEALARPSSGRRA